MYFVYEFKYSSRRGPVLHFAVQVFIRFSELSGNKNREKGHDREMRKEFTRKKGGSFVH